MKLSYGYMPDLASLLTLPADSVGEDVTSDHDLTLSHTFVLRLEELELYCIMFSPGNNWSDDIISEQFLLDALSTHKALHLTMTKCDVIVREEADEEADEDKEDKDRPDVCRCNLCVIFG